jgi:hypothetical protein
LGLTGLNFAIKWPANAGHLGWYQGWAE